MTPTREEIEAKARELYVAEQYRCGTPQLADLNPSIEELKESGFYMLAGNLLMHDNDEYKHYLASELGENVEDFKTKPQAFDFDLSEALKSGVFVSGGKQTGKTNHAKTLADLFMKHGCVVKVFDISQQWLDSNVPYCIEVNRNVPYDIPLYKSVVFDLSKLYSNEVKAFVSQILSLEFALQVATPKPERKWIIYFLEECQMLVPQGKLRGKEAQDVLRLMSSGANYNLSYVAITQRPSTVDTTVMELAYQKYFARCDGENDKAKIKTYVGEDYASQLESLNVGEFIYDKGDTTKKIVTKRFFSATKPQLIQSTEQQPQQLEQPNSAIGYLILGVAFLGWLILLFQWLRG